MPPSVSHALRRAPAVSSATRGGPRPSGGRGHRPRHPRAAHEAGRPAAPTARAPGLEPDGGPTWLIRLHRRSLFHLLLLGGTGGERARVALDFHRASLLGRGPFVRVRGDQDEERLQSALQCALSAVKCERPDSPLRQSLGGTLFVDRVSRLSLVTQNLMLRFLDGLTTPASAPRAWAGRLAVGSPEPLESAVATGRFLPALYDLLDKIRVELHPGPAAGVR
jgi:transcriptional regulator of acetoin/glycerol metabolism